MALIKEHVFGCQKKGIKGAARQCANGEGPFAALCDVAVRDTNKELLLKEVVCGKDTNRFYVAGVNLTADLISCVKFT